MTVTQKAPRRRTPPDPGRAAYIRQAALILLDVGLTPEGVRECAIGAASVLPEIADDMAAVLAERAAAGAR
jgi:hypothetical protein